MVINHLVLPCSLNHRCKNLPGRLHRQLNYVLWHQIFVSPQCKTCYVTLMAPRILRRLLVYLKSLCFLALHSHEVQSMVYVDQNMCKEANMVSAPKIPTIVTLYLPSQNLVPHLFRYLYT
jgi:hypothetical protein